MLFRIQLKTLRAWVLLLLFATVGASAFSQVSFLKVIGGSEHELQTMLDSQDGQPFTRKFGASIEYQFQDLKSIYSLNRGKVVSIQLHQDFSSEDEANQAFNASREFLNERGLAVRQTKNQSTFQVVQGRGNGVEAHISMVAVGELYRLNACLNSNY